LHNCNTKEIFTDLLPGKVPRLSKVYYLGFFKKKFNLSSFLYNFVKLCLLT